MRHLSVAVALTAALMLLTAPPAHADCQWVEEVRAVNGVMEVHSSIRCPGGSESGSIQGTSAQPPRDSDWDAICVRTAISTGQAPGPYCNEPLETAATPPTLTPGLVARAFRQLTLPASELVVEPPGGRTLVNFETNFYTEGGEFTRVVELVGRRVELRIRPVRFGWRFGDGTERWTTSPGDAYPNLVVTHRYLSKGRVSASVATTYAARFRVGGGAWREVAGTVTVPGGPVGLRVVTARPVLVGGD